MHCIHMFCRHPIETLCSAAQIRFDINTALENDRMFFAESCSLQLRLSVHNRYEHRVVGETTWLRTCVSWDSSSKTWRHLRTDLQLTVSESTSPGLDVKKRLAHEREHESHVRAPERLHLEDRLQRRNVHERGSSPPTVASSIRFRRARTRGRGSGSRTRGRGTRTP
jgi:hypothetical protein